MVGIIRQKFKNIFGLAVHNRRHLSDKGYRGIIMLKKSLLAKTDAKADESQIFIRDGVRITYLSPRLIRVETGEFTDLPSYAVWFRRFEPGNMRVLTGRNTISVETDEIILTVKNKKPHSVLFKDSGVTELFSRQKNLKGTYRTLDMTVGKIPLGDGFITKNGLYLFDDSKSVLIDEKGYACAAKRQLG